MSVPGDQLVVREAEHLAPPGVELAMHVERCSGQGVMEAILAAIGRDEARVRGRGGGGIGPRGGGGIWGLAGRRRAGRVGIAAPTVVAGIVIVTAADHGERPHARRPPQPRSP